MRHPDGREMTRLLLKVTEVTDFLFLRREVPPFRPTVKARSSMRSLQVRELPSVTL